MDKLGTRKPLSLGGGKKGMDREELKTAIVEGAKRDLFQGVGRILIGSLKKNFKITEGEIMEALKLIPYRYRIWPDSNGMILVYFEERNLTPTLARRARSRSARRNKSIVPRRL